MGSRLSGWLIAIVAGVVTYAGLYIGFVALAPSPEDNKTKDNKVIASNPEPTDQKLPEPSTKTEPEPKKTEPEPKKTEPKKTEPEPKKTEPEPKKTEPEPKKTEPKKTEPEPKKTEPKKTEPEPKKTEPEPKKTEPEPKKTEPEPKKTEPEPKKTEPKKTEPKKSRLPLDPKGGFATNDCRPEPAYPALGVWGNLPRDQYITIYLGVNPDSTSLKVVFAELKKLTDDPALTKFEEASISGKRWVWLYPVADLDAFAKRVEFGKVLDVNPVDRGITIHPYKMRRTP